MVGLIESGSWLPDMDEETWRALVEWFSVVEGETERDLLNESAKKMGGEITTGTGKGCGGG